MNISNSKERSGWGAYLLLLIAIAGIGVVATLYAIERSRVSELEAKITSSQDTVRQLQLDLAAEKKVEPVTFISKKGVSLKVYSPQSGVKVTSPLGVIGQVPGTWSFEADFPAILKDATGRVLVQTPATVQGDWMTENMVPFAVTLIFDTPTTKTGTLTLQKDNPSGLAEHEDFVDIPVVFE